MNITLMIVAAIGIISLIQGFRKGLINMALASLVVLAALLFTQLAYPHVQTILMTHTPVFSTVQEQVSDFLEEKLKEDPEGPCMEDPSMLDSCSVGEQSALIEHLPLPTMVRRMLTENNNPEIYRLMGANGFSDYMVLFLSRMIVTVLAYVLTYLILYAALRLILGMLNLVAKLPGLNLINKIGGMAVSLIFTVVGVWIFFLIATALSGIGFGQMVIRDVRESQILSLIYDNNVLLQLISDIEKWFF